MDVHASAGAVRVLVCSVLVVRVLVCSASYQRFGVVRPHARPLLRLWKKSSPRTRCAPI